MNPASQVWLAEIANVRIHGETHRRPADLFAEERAHLKPANVNPYDLARVLTLRASSQFRIVLDTNRYSGPASHAGRRVTVKVYPDRLCIYYQDQLIARHGCSFDRRQDIEDPGHPQVLLERRHNAREQRLLSQFLALTGSANAYYEGLTARRFNARSHVRKIPIHPNSVLKAECQNEPSGREDREAQMTANGWQVLVSGYQVWRFSA